MIDLVAELLAASLEAWQVEGTVACEGEAVVVRAGAVTLRVSRAAAALPFRWMIARDGRSRGASSIAGLLRAVRAALDPDHRPVRLRIAPLPIAPP